jgi:hypothetical protein
MQTTGRYQSQLQRIPTIKGIPRPMYGLCSHHANGLSEQERETLSAWEPWEKTDDRQGDGFTAIVLLLAVITSGWQKSPCDICLNWIGFLFCFHKLLGQPPDSTLSVPRLHEKTQSLSVTHDPRWLLAPWSHAHIPPSRWTQVLLVESTFQQLTPDFTLTSLGKPCARVTHTCQGRWWTLPSSQQTLVLCEVSLVLWPQPCLLHKDHLASWGQREGKCEKTLLGELGKWK